MIIVMLAVRCLSVWQVPDASDTTNCHWALWTFVSLVVGDVSSSVVWLFMSRTVTSPPLYHTHVPVRYVTVLLETDYIFIYVFVVQSDLVYLLQIMLFVTYLYCVGFDSYVCKSLMHNAEVLRHLIGLTGWLTGWLGNFLSTRFLRIYKRHESQTLIANSMCWEVDVHLILINFLYFSPQNMQNLIVLWWLMYWHQVYVGVLLLLQCHYYVSLKVKLGRLSSSVCTLLMMRFLQSVPRVQRWWFSGAIYWYFWIMANSRGGHSYYRRRIYRCPQSPSRFSDTQNTCTSFKLLMIFTMFWSNH